MKRWLLIFGPAVFFLVIVIVGLQIARPYAEKFVLANLELLSRERLPVKIQAKEFHLTFFPPEAEFSEVRVQAKPELGVGPLFAVADRIDAKLDLIQLLAGRLQLSAVLIEGAGAELDLDPFLKDDEKSKPIDWTPIFQLLAKTPVSRFALQGASLHLKSPKMQLETDITEFDLLLVNEIERLQAHLDLKDAAVVWSDLATPLRAQADATLSPQGLDIQDLRVLGLGSLLRGSASFKNLPYLFLSPEGSLKFEMKAALDQTEQLLKQLKQTPHMEGSLEARGSVDLEGGAVTGGGFRLFGQRLVVGEFEIGQIETEARLVGNDIKIPHLALTHEAGLVDISDLEVKLIREHKKIERAEVKANIKSDAVDVHELLARLGVGDIPVELFLAAHVGCAGPVWPEVSVRCEGSADAEGLEIRADRKDKPLIVINSFGANGNFTVDLDKVTYNAKVTAGQDEGQSSGTISYKKGFDIAFSTPRLHLSNIHTLANLKLEGSASIQGTTVGGSKAAKFEMNVDAQDFIFEDFLLGKPRGHVRYEKEQLFFENMEGTLGASAYTGQVAVDLDKKRIETHVHSERIELADVTALLARRLKIPVEINGSGILDVSASGPFEISQLSFDAKSKFSRVVVAGEGFDQLLVEAHSREGEFMFDRAVATKGVHQIHLTGVGHPSGQVQFLAEGRELPLEQSENISLLNSNISGILNFSLQVTDDIRRPHLLLKTQAKNIVVEEQELPETESEIRFTPTEMAGTASLVGGRLRSSFQIPLQETGPFSLEVQSKDWNFTTLFALLGSGPLLSEYQASLTGTLALKSEHGGFWKSTGEASVDRVFLKRGSLSLENKGRLQVLMNAGVFSVENFVLQGPSTQIELQGNHNTREELDLRVKVDTELRLFQIFLPFLEEFSGHSQVSMNLGGSLTKPELLGSGQTDHAFVKIHGFPHPIEKITSDVQFSQSRVLINEAHGEIAGGTFKAEGNIQINGLHDVPTQVHATMTGVSLNVPDHVQTNGFGDLNFTGNWFPFTLSGVYHVQGGLVDKEFADDNLTNSIQKSSYLPKMILQKAFEPLNLDLQILLDQPLKVKNSMVDGAVLGQLQVKGLPANPLIFGQLTADHGTKLLVRDKVFDVITANVKFSDPKEINPELYASARTRVNEYDISLLVQGNAKAPVVRMSSLPPLAERDIVSLLALGVTATPDRTKKNASTQNEQDNGQYQIVTGVLQQISLFQKAQKATGFNVKFSSSYDDTKNIEVKTVTISRQVTDKIKASATGYVDQSSRDYKIEYLLNPSVSAIGTYRQQETTVTQPNLEQQRRESILGIDLEYRKEFH